MIKSSQTSAERFNSAASAAKYSVALSGSATDRREQRCLDRLLRDVPAGSAILDLPSGTGRMLPFLSGLGYAVTAADSSEHMITRAREFAARNNLPIPGERFIVTDIMGTPFPDKTFDAIVCNRLFHHFTEPETRQAALRELNRICKGIIVVSFFRSPTWGSLTFAFKYMLRGVKPVDRIPIRLSAFGRDIQEAGLAIRRVLPTRRFISRNCYLALGVPGSSGDTMRIRRTS